MIVAYALNGNGKVELTLEELNRLMEQAYNEGQHSIQYVPIFDRPSDKKNWEITC